MGLLDGMDILKARTTSNVTDNDRSADLRLKARTDPNPAPRIINQEGTSVRYGGNNITTNDLAADVNLKKRDYGAGGRSKYSDAEIAFMVGGGGAKAPATTTNRSDGRSNDGDSTKNNRRPDGDGETTTTGGTVIDPVTGEEVPVEELALGGVSSRAIEGQIAALEAQYGLDLASIAALGGEIGQQARFLLDQLNIDQGRAQEDLIGNLVGRGVFRSGITARDMGRQLQDFTGQRAEIEMNKGSRLRQLAERAGAAAASLGRGKADVIANIDQGNLPAEIRSRLLGELQGLTPADIQLALDNAYTGNQQSLSALIDRVGQGGLNFSGQNVDNAISSYTGPSVVGGYNIDPATGLATGTGGVSSAQSVPTGGAAIPRSQPTIDPEELNKLLMSGKLAGFSNALQTAPRGVQG